MSDVPNTNAEGSDPPQPDFPETVILEPLILEQEGDVNPFDSESLYERRRTRYDEDFKDGNSIVKP